MIFPDFRSFWRWPWVGFVFPQVGLLFVQMPGCNLARYGDLESLTRAELILILLTYGGMCDLA